MDADHAIRLLQEGNRRFSGGRPRRPRRDVARRTEVATGQQPWAMVLSCADSRVVPELIFDVGLGDLFVVRVAGNVASAVVIESLELSAIEFGCPLLVVLGHRGCGACQAALDTGPERPGRVSDLTRRIAASCVDVDRLGDNPVDELVLRNVRHQVEVLRRTPPVLSTLVADGRLRVVGGVYELDSGRVGFLADPTRQESPE